MEQMTVSSLVQGNEILSAHAHTDISPELVSTSILHEPPLFYHFLKRTIDIVFSLIGLILLIPVFLVIALCIKVDDGGDILHFREIVGQNGRRFYALKFRTMISDADGYLAKHPELMRRFQKNMKLTNDPRITQIGRFLRRTSLDELPQLVNVLMGDMSLVGPRMIHPSELPRYGQWAQKRLSVPPGITGLWQLHRRHISRYEERIVLDMEYIDNRSSIGDLTILVKTLTVFIKPTGI